MGLVDPRYIPSSLSIYLLKTKGPNSKFFRIDGKRNFGNKFTKIIYFWKCFLILLKDPSFNFMLFYIIISITSINNELFYSLHLLDIMVYSFN